MKKTKLPSLKSREDADAAVARFVDRQLKNVEAIGKMEAEIKEIRDKYRVQVNSLEEEIENLFEQLEQWAIVNPGLFADRKSLEFAHGTIGFRTAPPKLKPIGKFTWERILDLIQCEPKLAKKYIRIKNEVDREALLADRDDLGPETLETIALRVIQDETFYVDPKTEERAS
jgi:phage host-nuclease inhibitor protein Gam